MLKFKPQAAFAVRMIRAAQCLGKAAQHRGFKAVLAAALLAVLAAPTPQAIAEQGDNSLAALPGPQLQSAMPLNAAGQASSLLSAVVPGMQPSGSASAVSPSREHGLMDEAVALGAGATQAIRDGVRNIVNKAGEQLAALRQSGIASWYGKQFHGKTTANGESFDMNALTAAHRTLPMASVVRVTNRDNGKSVVVRINDRGPYAHGRLIDLSFAAARELGMIGRGTGNVEIEPIEMPGEQKAAKRP